MKREELKTLGLEDEVIEKIMKSNGDDINTLKAQNAEIKKSLEEANATVQSFKEMKIDEIKASAEKYKADYENEVKKRERVVFDTAIQSAIKDADAKDVLAVKAHLDMDKIKLDGEVLTGINKQLDDLKKDKGTAFLFNEKKTITTGGEHNQPAGDSDKSYLDAKYKNNPYYKG